MTPFSDDAVPTVSVIVVSYNHSRYVVECLDSIAAQSFRDFELILVDDNSTDDTVDRVERWAENAQLSLQVVRNSENRGICRNLNVALELAKGEFISYVSADDRYEPSKLEVQLAAFREAATQVAVVYGDVSVIDGASRVVERSWYADGRHGTPPSGRVFERLIDRTNFVPAPSAMIRRAALAEIGGYDESMLFEDLDTWLQISREHEFLFVPELVASWRRLPSSLSNDHSRIGGIRLSRARALDKCFGVSPSTDRKILHRNWAMALHTVGVDRAAGFELMEMVIRRDDRVWRRGVRHAMRIPGLGPITSGTLTARDGLRRKLR